MTNGTSENVEDINVHVLDAEQNLLEKCNFCNKYHRKAVSDSE